MCERRRMNACLLRAKFAGYHEKDRDIWSDIPHDLIDCLPHRFRVTLKVHSDGPC